MKQVMFIELGMGVDLQGQDATKAATRAVRDAIGRNYLPGIRRMLEDSRGRMLVHVRLGAPAEAPPPDLAAVRASLPHGEVTVEVVPGGMLVPNGLDDGGTICVVNAAVEVAVGRRQSVPAACRRLRPLDQQRDAGHGDEHGGQDQERVGERHHQRLRPHRLRQRLEGRGAGVGAQALQLLRQARPAARARRRWPR